MPFDFVPHFNRALPYHVLLERYANDDQRKRWQGVYDAVALTPAQQSLLAGFRRQMKVLCLTGVWCGDCVNACPIFQRFAEAQGLIDLRFIHRAQRWEAPSADAPAPAGAAPDPEDIRSKPIGKILVAWGILTPERVEKALLAQEEQKQKGMEIRIGDVMKQMGLVTENELDRALAAQMGFASMEDADRQVAVELSICGAPRVPMLVFISEDNYECGRFGERTLATYRDKVMKMQGAACPTGLVAPPSDLLQANVNEWLGYFERIQLMLMTSPRLMKLHGEV